MSLLVANDIGVISGSINMPLNGAWTANLVIDQSDLSGFDAGTAVTLKADNGFELHGTVMADRSGTFLDAVHLYVIGGAAGMNKVVQSRGFVQPGAFVSDVLNGIASDSGEALSSDIDSSLLTTNITAWTTMQATAVQALNMFLGFVAPTADWRFLADGKLWVGVETWPTSSDDFDVLSLSPATGTALLGIVAPSILPGVALDGVGNVSRVLHTVQEAGVRSQVWLDLASEERGLSASIAAVVKQQMSGVDYFGLYECKVVSQSADLSTVDVQPLAPVDKKLPGLSRVELRAGTGIAVQFTPGAKVLLGWKGGNPTLPYVVPGLGGDSFAALTIGGPTTDNVATKADITALIQVIAGLTYLPGPGVATPVTMTVPVPTAYASTSVKVQR